MCIYVINYTRMCSHMWLMCIYVVNCTRMCAYMWLTIHVHG